MVANIPPKLYKFQSFDSDKSIENLRCSQIWFSKPKGLNDPFDCDISINFIDMDNEEVMLDSFENYHFEGLRKSGKVEEISIFKQQHFPNGKPDQKALAEARKVFLEYSQSQRASYEDMGGCLFHNGIREYSNVVPLCQWTQRFLP